MSFGLDYPRTEAPPTEAIIYKRTRTIDLRLWMFKPSAWERGGRRPAVIFMHGGGWNKKNIGMFVYQAQVFAARGLVAFIADYRSMRLDGVAIPELMGDARSAIRYLRQHASELGIDEQRVLAAGGSSGGHLMSAAATIFDPVFDDAKDDTSISHCPNLFIGFNPVMVKDGPATSPASYVTTDTIPMAMCYGSEDATYLPGALEFKAAMEACKRPFEFHLYAGEGHGFFNRTKKVETLSRLIAFAETYGY